MIRRQNAVVSALIGLSIATVATAQRPRSFADLRGFDEWVTTTMAEWHIPGLAIGVIRDGQVVVAKGYGFRDVEGREPVTSRTVMGIGSNSKSFTVVLMGMLADEKKLDWDAPVRTYLSDFRLWDDFATREMTPKDLVSHRSGLPRHDNAWYGRPFSREELYQRLRYLEPNASFRSRYQYQNLMFMTAGYLVEKISGRGWDELIRDRIFMPLGMLRSNTSVRETPGAGDFAFPYTWRNDSLIRLPFRNIDAVGPAGSINSSVDDMLNYIQFRIDQGQFGGKRLLSEANERLMQSPQMVTGASVDHPELGHAAYGLGVGVSTYRGAKLVSHGGGIDGYISAMSWMPDERIGIVVLTNLSGNNPVPTIVMRTMYDRLLGVPAVDWVARQRAADARARERQERTRQERLADRRPGTQPSHGIADYAGTYEHPGYGTLVIAPSSGLDLTATLAPHQARLTHFHYDVWEIQDPGGVVPFSGRVRFVTNAKGVVERVLVPLEPAGADIAFVRK
ncbi:MAG: serine hydrolase [Gemmatimonadetes bacterium]|nr:serine hydrolase [Gemmatimonadota bacterium]